MKLAIIGNGRMGKMIENVCGEDFEVAGFVGPGDHTHPDEIADAQVMIDFSYPGNLEAVLYSAVRQKLPLVIGTTGLSAEQGDAIRAASDMIPIVWANNFSTGVTVLVRLARMAAEALGEDFDIEITETHHNQKEDAPSGTAKMLLSAVDPHGEKPRLGIGARDLDALVADRNLVEPRKLARPEFIEVLGLGFLRQRERIDVYSRAAVEEDALRRLLEFVHGLLPLRG